MEMRRVFRLPEMVPVRNRQSADLVVYNKDVISNSTSSDDEIQVRSDTGLWSTWAARTHRDSPQDNPIETNAEDSITSWNSKKQSLTSKFRSKAVSFYSDGNKRRKTADTAYAPRVGDNGSAVWLLSDTEDENELDNGHNDPAKVNGERSSSAAVERHVEQQHISSELGRRLADPSLEISETRNGDHGLDSTVQKHQSRNIALSQRHALRPLRPALGVSGASTNNASSRNTAIVDHSAQTSVPQTTVLPEAPTESASFATHLDATRLTAERRAASEHLNQFAHLTQNDRTEALLQLVEKDRQNMMQSSVWTSHEDALLIHVKEDLALTWDEIWKRFFHHRGKSWHTSQTRYSQKLAIRARFDPARHAKNVTSSLSIQNETPALQPIRKSTRRPPVPASGSSMYLPDERDFEEDNQKREAEIWHSGVDDIEEPGLQAVTLPFQTTNENKKEARSSSTARRPSLQHVPYERLFEERNRTQAALISCTVKIPRGSPSWSGPLPARVFVRHDAVSHSWKPLTRPFKRRSLDVQRPYLSHVERRFLQQSIDRQLWHNDETSLWQEQVLHVDFTYEEMQSLYPFVIRVLCPQYTSLPFRLAFADMLKDANEEQLQKIARSAQSKGGICNRTVDSLESFLRDNKSHEERSNTYYQRLSLCPPSETAAKPNLHSFLRFRELGMSKTHLAGRIPSSFRDAVEGTMGPLLSFTGTSGDVNMVSWAPNGELFAAGSAALADDHSMQYNLPNNLLLGNSVSKILSELPHHATKRHRTASGVNSLYSMQASQDPLLFQSVSAVQFSADSKALISTGYDNFARVWDLRGPSPVCKWSFRHRAVVDVLAINSGGLFATGAQRFGANSIRVLKHDLDCEDPASLKVFSFCSPKAQTSAEKQLYPTTLRWGNSIYAQQRYLLGGFTSKLEENGEGETCIWDIEAQQQTATTRGTRGVFDVAWCPSIFGRFAVGSAAGGPSRVNKGTRSVVRIYDARYLPSGHDNRGSDLAVNKWKTCELESSAPDMNDVVFNPSDPWLVSAGFTNGSTDVWDLRNPNEVLHRFSHGPAVMELDHRLGRDEADTGVRFLSWGGTRQRLYTGSSDGVVAQWDPYRAPEDAYVRKVVQLNSGVMSGAFSPDFSNLLLGEVNGSIMMLGLNQTEDEGTIRDCEQFSLEKADEANRREVYKSLEIEAPIVTDSQNEGIAASRQLVDAGEITFRPFGNLPFRQAVQGPNYAGPFDTSDSAEHLRRRAEEFQDKFKLSESKVQISDRGVNSVTEEERGDSRAWEQRIPASFRFTKSRNELTCLRCEAKLWRDVESDCVTCGSCEQTWRVDLLGYSTMLSNNQPPTKTKYTTVDDLNDMYDNEQCKSEIHETGDSDDELQDLEDYLHSLWLDRPPSSI